MSTTRNPDDFSLTLSTLTNEHLIACLKWLEDMGQSDRWNFTNEEISEILGISLESYAEAKQNAANNLKIKLEPDTIERISLLLKIWKTLRIVAPNGRLDLAYSFFNRSNTNSMFCGLSIKQYLLQHNSTTAFYDVLQYLPPVSP